ncbi:MAG TPA: glucokinase, partial [Brevundimonas sp.]|nr:glucokinase [Brevundimonas sp.]
MSPAPLHLVGDVGGTNARFALSRMVDGVPRVEHHESFPAEDHPTFLDGVRAFLEGCNERPDGGAIAVAGPVTDGFIDLTNSPWRVSEAELASLGVGPIRLINDFEALAWAAPLIEGPDLAHLGGPGTGDPLQTLAVLGPGTGFGVSALARDRWGSAVALASEGGHVDFPPSDAIEDEVLRILRRRYTRVSI